MFQKTYLQFDKWEVMGIQTCRRSHISQIYLFQFWTKDIVRNAVAAVLRAYGNIFFFLKYILRRKQHHFIKLTPSDHQKVFRSMLTNGDKNVLIYALVRVNLSGYIIWHFASLSGNCVLSQNKYKIQLCFVMLFCTSPVFCSLTARLKRPKKWNGRVPKPKCASSCFRMIWSPLPGIGW